MLKKSLTGLLAASAISIPLAAVAWADPTPNPNPPAVPQANGQPGNPNAPATPEAYGQNPANPTAPAAPGGNGAGPVCVVSANVPTQGIGAQGTANQGASSDTWRQVATLQGSVATQLGLNGGQPMKVFCAPAGTENPQGQPVSVENPGQPTIGQIPAQNPLPGQPPAPGQNPLPGQNPMPGQQ
jgi:hypothetical protein